VSSGTLKPAYSPLNLGSILCICRFFTAAKADIMRSGQFAYHVILAVIDKDADIEEDYANLQKH